MISLNAADQALQMAVDDIMDGLAYDTITYIPISGSTRSIKAILEWPGAEEIMGLTGGSRPIVNIYLENHISQGISAAEIDTGGDKIDLPLRYGLDNSRVRIIEIVAQDRTILHLRCQ